MGSNFASWRFFMHGEGMPRPLRIEYLAAVYHVTARGNARMPIFEDDGDRVKRPDTALLFFTDGLTWKQRKSDLRKIVEFQNNGDITHIYTLAIAKQFESDLRELKAEYKL